MTTAKPGPRRAASVFPGAALAVPGNVEERGQLGGENPAAEAPTIPVRVPHRPGVDPVVPEVSLKPVPTHRTAPKAGRNLPVATLVGVLLALIAASAVFVVPVMFTPLVVLVTVIGVLEVTNAFTRANLRVPVIPLLVASVGMVVSASVYGADGLLVSTAVGVLVLIAWRVVEATGLMAVRDTVASIFALLWVPFLAGFAILLMAQEDGEYKILLAITVPVANDVCGYLVGVVIGKHPMAPSISPKKSWEGFFGSLVGGVSAAALICHYLLPGIPWTVGAGIGTIMVVVATMGDLCESLLKRDLGIKDMGQLLPGHGGAMDRLDSMLLTAPTLFIVLAILEAFGG